MTTFLTLNELQFNGKTVLVRVDLNVPMQDGKVTDVTRLERLIPTLKKLSEAGAKIVLLSHFGRPDGKPNPKYSLRPVAAELGKIWRQPIAFAEDCIGPEAQKAIAALQAGQILVLENTRFHAGEEANDKNFAQQMAALGDIYVNDAFSAAHRAHASTTALAELLPAAAGLLMQQEIEALTKALEKPERPVLAIVGGSKISTKLDLLQNLVGKMNVLVLGGAMANTFVKAKGMDIGISMFEHNMLDTARAIITKAEKHGCHILLPKDVVVAPELKPNITTQTVAVTAVPPDQRILDVGPETVADIKHHIARCRTVLWNGPLGVFEVPPFDKATNAIATFAAELTQQGKILSVAGGGDTAAALANAGVADKLSYLSTAGGAFLEWLEGKELPGVAALQQAAAAA